MIASVVRKKLKLKTCPICKERFQPGSSLQKYDKLDCAKQAATKSAKRLRRKKTAPLKAIRKRLDAVCREYVMSHYDRCVVCGSVQNPQPGHLITRACQSVRWELTNLARQCRTCNFNHEFKPEAYTSWFIRKYGIDAYDVLRFRSTQPDLRTIEELEQLYEEIKAQV